MRACEAAVTVALALAGSGEAAGAASPRVEPSVKSAGAALSFRARDEAHPLVARGAAGSRAAAARRCSMAAADSVWCASA